MNNLPDSTLTITIGEEHDGTRLDTYLASVERICSRSQLAHYRLTASTGGKEVKLSRRIRPGETYRISYSVPQEPDIGPEEMDLQVLYEDDDVVVIDKPQGMVVHPARGNYTGTLVQGLLFHCNGKEGNFPEEDLRPGIVHRLDKDTSGVIITAKHVKAQEYLASQFRKRKVQKVYYAVVKGRPRQQEGIIDKPIIRDRTHRKRFATTESGGKAALTRYRLKRTVGGYSLLALSPKTGRTHQLRVHCAGMGNPILGDPVYARKDSRFPEVTMMLHAYSLKIRLPGNGEVHTFTAPLPERFSSFLRRRMT